MPTAACTQPSTWAAPGQLQLRFRHLVLEIKDYVGIVSEGKPIPVLIGSGVPQVCFGLLSSGLLSSGDRRVSTMPQHKLAEDVEGSPVEPSSSAGCGMDADATGRSAAVLKAVVSNHGLDNRHILGPKVSCHRNGGRQGMAEGGEIGCEGINSSSRSSGKGVKRKREPTNLDHLRKGGYRHLYKACKKAQGEGAGRTKTK